MIDDTSLYKDINLRALEVTKRVWDEIASIDKVENIREWPEIKEYLPPLGLPEREALRKSIERDGVQQPILVLRDGRIIDGHHRWDLSGGNAPHIVLDLSEEKALDLAIELNLSRRQLSREQIAAINKKREERRQEKQAEAMRLRMEGATQAEAAEVVSVARNTISVWEDRTNVNDKNIDISSIPDNRIKIPRSQHSTIYERWMDGESQEQIAADYQVTQRAIGKICQKENEKRDHRQVIEDKVAALKTTTDAFTLLQGDLKDMGPTLPADAFDVILTDPPYAAKDVPLYGLLAEQAARLLKPGGSLLAMAGQSYLPAVLNLMTPHLNYHWMVAYLTPGGQSAQLWTRKVNTFWKPVLWFVKGDFEGSWIGDVARSEVNDNDKRYHEWGQSESGMADLVRRFSGVGDHILDPFCGAGTTGVVALTLKRRFTGIDIDPDNIQTSRLRLAIAVDESELGDL